MSIHKFLGLLLLIPAISPAVDGVREINQLCAVTGGCFNGDAEGYPLTLSNPGSYRLTSNLDVSGLPGPEDIIIIQISGSDISLDLNGFSIIGGLTCTGTPVTSCAPAGPNGAGVLVSGSADDVEISNGRIHGVGLAGILCLQNCKVNNMVLSENIFGLSAEGNDYGVFINNVARRNLSDGFAGNGLFEGNIATGNGGDGIDADAVSLVIGNQSSNNGGDGVNCSTCTLLNNTISMNAGFGADYSGNSVAGGNLITDNTMGEIDGTPFEVAPNRCGAVAC